MSILQKGRILEKQTSPARTYARLSSVEKDILSAVPASPAAGVSPDRTQADDTGRTPATTAPPAPSPARGSLLETSPAAASAVDPSGGSQNKTPAFEPGFVGLMVSPDPPHAVSVVEDLVDINGVVQNEQKDGGLSNQGPTMTSPPEANSDSPDHSMGASKAAALPDPVQLTMTLGMSFHETGEESSSKREAFKRDVADDLAKASGLPAENFKITKLSAGSVIVDIDILPDPLGIAPTPSAVARDLIKQADDPNSPLRSGKLTSQTNWIQVLSPQPSTGAPPPPPIQTVAEEKGSPIPPVVSLPAPPILSEPPTAIELSKEVVAIQPHPSHIETAAAAPATSPVPESINDEPNPSRTSSSPLPLPTVKDMVTEQPPQEKEREAPQEKESEAAVVPENISVVPNSVTPVKSITEVDGATGVGRGRPGLLFYPNADFSLVINDVIVGTHAAESGIEIGDVIVKVQGESIEGQPMDVVMEAFAGPMESELTVTVRKHSADKKVRFTLIRDLPVQSQHSSAIQLPRSLSGSCTLSIPTKGSSTPKFLPTTPANLPTKEAEEGNCEMPRAAPGVGVSVYIYTYLHVCMLLVMFFYICDTYLRRLSRACQVCVCVCVCV